MRALIDADILQYEIAFAAETRWKHIQIEAGREPDGSPPPYGLIPEMVDQRIAHILQQSGAEGEPIFFFTGEKNFRFDIAFTQPYKVRTGEKPFHYRSVKTYIVDKYRSYELEGLEADDLIGIWMTTYPGKYICCSRDKDLKQIPGWHFGWEVHKQPQFGPMEIDELGFLELRVKNDKDKTKYLVGGGEKFFFSQMLTGDSVDSIPGCDGIGPVYAFSRLKDCGTIEDCAKKVQEEYRRRFGLYYPDVYLEQGRLLRMVRQLDERRSPVLWNPSLFERS